LQHLQLSDVGAGSKHPRGLCIINHTPDELLIKHHSDSDAEITLPVKKGTQHTRPLRSFLFGLIDVRRQDELFILAQSRIRSCIDPLDWIHKRRKWSGIDVAPSGKDYRGVLRDIYGDSPFSQPQV